MSITRENTTWSYSSETGSIELPDLHCSRSASNLSIDGSVPYPDTDQLTPQCHSSNCLSPSTAHSNSKLPSSKIKHDKQDLASLAGSYLPSREGTYAGNSSQQSRPSIKLKNTERYSMRDNTLLVAESTELGMDLKAHMETPSRTKTDSSLKNKKEFTGSRSPAYLQAQEREFTFTGYDVLKDKKDGPEERPSTAEQLRRRFQKVYCAMCRQLDIVPATFIKNRISQPDIRVSGRGLGDKGLKALAVALVNNIFVNEMDLSDNGLTSDGLTSLAEALTNNTSLTHLDLSENNISDAGVSAICSTMAQQNILKVLRLAGTSLKDSDIVHVKHMLDSNMFLRELYISQNTIGEEGCKLLRKAIADNDTLEVLDLSWNHIRGKGAIAIAEGLRDNRGLRVLKVAWNGFALDGTTALALALARNKTLQELDLSANRVHAQAMAELVKGLNYNYTLTNINLSQNPLTSEAAYILLQSLLNMNSSALRHINIWDIVVDARFLALYDELQDMRNLTVVHGPVLSHTGHDIGTVSLEDEFAKLDPRELLMRIMERDGLRVIDLFKRIDGDESWSVSRQEFKDGIRKHDLPVTEKQLDDLIEIMDYDANGEIDLNLLNSPKSKPSGGQKGDVASPERLQTQAAAT